MYQKLVNMRFFSYITGWFIISAARPLKQITKWKIAPARENCRGSWHSYIAAINHCACACMVNNCAWNLQTFVCKLHGCPLYVQLWCMHTQRFANFIMVYASTIKPAYIMLQSVWPYICLFSVNSRSHPPNIVQAKTLPYLHGVNISNAMGEYLSVHPGTHSYANSHPYMWPW